MPLSREEHFFKEIHQFYTFYPNITSPLGGVMKFTQVLVSKPYKCCIRHLVKIGPSVLEKKMLTHDGRQPIAIGDLSDSGDLKISFSKKMRMS